MRRIEGLTYTSPVKFRRGQRVALAIVPRVASVLMKGWMSCCRTEVRGQEHYRSLMDSGSRALLAFWHESMGLAVWHYRNTGFHTLTSYSYDGEMAARLVGRFGVLALRGSSSKGGSEAIRSMSIAIQQVGAIGITLDGPRGPRRVAKPGIAILSIRTQTPILPHALAVYPAWRLHSWDRFPVPKPLSLIHI